MTCDFCGFAIEIEASREGCAACSAWGGGCKFVKCPRCGYEMPEPLAMPAWVTRLKARLEARRDSRLEARSTRSSVVASKPEQETGDVRDASGHAI